MNSLNASVSPSVSGKNIYPQDFWFNEFMVVINSAHIQSVFFADIIIVLAFQGLGLAYEIEVISLLVYRVTTEGSESQMPANSSVNTSVRPSSTQGSVLLTEKPAYL